MTVDERTNTLLVRDTAAKLEDIRRLVARLDIPVRQVLIESRVVIACDTFAKDIGVRFGATKRSELDNHFLDIGGAKPCYLNGTSGVADTSFVVAGDDEAETAEALMVNLPQTLSGTRGGVSTSFLVRSAPICSSLSSRPRSRRVRVRRSPAPG